ncbi:hypothetical protein K8T06_16130, partial [bacterium]|nr:hypothetical protein [bacterium]
MLYNKTQINTDDHIISKKFQLHHGYLINIFQRQRKGKSIIYAIGRLKSGQTFGLVHSQDHPCFYIRSSDKTKTDKFLTNHIRIQNTELNTMDGESVFRISFKNMSAQHIFAQILSDNAIRTYEADIIFTHQFLMNRGLHRSVIINGPSEPGKDVDLVFINPELTPSEWEPKLTVLIMDVETSENADSIRAISLVGTGTQKHHNSEEIHMISSSSPDDPPELTSHPDERILLKTIALRIKRLDPDIITGWNIIDLGLPILQKRFKSWDIDFNIGRTADGSWCREKMRRGISRMIVYGRQILDARHLIRTTPDKYTDYRLDTVARTVLGRGKTVLTADDNSMPEYCLENACLIRDILNVEGLIELTVR